MAAPRIRYEIQDGDTWLTCKIAQPEERFGKQWLRYKLYDDTIGLKRPGTWRIKEAIHGR